MSNILIYGATSAIAQETARAYAQRGDALYLVGRDASRLESVAKDLEVRGASRVGFEAMDFDDFAVHEPSFEHAREALGDIDVVLVAHGMLADQAVVERDYKETEHMLRVNFLSVVSILTPIANAFEERGSGTIAVISSVAGDRGRQSNYIYGTAKGALNVYLQGLRNRLFKRGVHVLTIKPGFVSTPMTAHLDQGPLFASAEKVGMGIVRAVDKEKNEVYLPGFWRYIMGVIKTVPETVFKRLSL